MVDLVSAIEAYAGWLYLLLALLIARELVTIWRAGRDREIARFGLEREAATGRAVRSLITLVLLVTIAAGVYTVANVVSPTLPTDERRTEDVPLVATPPPAALVTETPTPVPLTPTPTPQRIITATPSGG